MASELSKRRSCIIKEIEKLRRMRRGQISEQYIDKRDADGQIRRYGPYYVWQASVKGKKRSIRVAQKDVESYRHDLKAYQRFRDLCEELAETTEQLTRETPIRDSKKNSRKSAKQSAKNSAAF